MQAATSHVQSGEATEEATIGKTMQFKKMIQTLKQIKMAQINILQEFLIKIMEIHGFQVILRGGLG